MPWLSWQRRHFSGSTGRVRDGLTVTVSITKATETLAAGMYKNIHFLKRVMVYFLIENTRRCLSRPCLEEHGQKCSIGTPRKVVPSNRTP